MDARDKAAVEKLIGDMQDDVMYREGYRAGLEDAAKVCEGRAKEIGEGSIGFTDVCVVIHRIRTLADKPTDHSER